MPVKVELDTCIGCGACTDVCPTGSLSIGPDGKCVCAVETCIDCGACVGTCPTGALSQ